MRSELIAEGLKSPPLPPVKEEKWSENRRPVRFDSVEPRWPGVCGKRAFASADQGFDSPVLAVRLLRNSGRRGTK